MPFTAPEIAKIQASLLDDLKQRMADELKHYEAFIGPRQPPTPTIEDEARDLKMYFEAKTPPDYHAAEIIQGLLDRIEALEDY